MIGMKWKFSMRVVIPRSVVAVPGMYSQLQTLILWAYGLNLMYIKRWNTPGGFLPYNFRTQRDPIPEKQLCSYIFERLDIRRE